MAERVAFTLRIPEKLHKRLKRYAEFRELDQKEVIVDAIERHLATKPDAGADPKVQAFIEAYLEEHHSKEESE